MTTGRERMDRAERAMIAGRYAAELRTRLEAAPTTDDLLLIVRHAEDYAALDPDNAHRFIAIVKDIRAILNPSPVAKGIEFLVEDVKERKIRRGFVGRKGGRPEADEGVVNWGKVFKTIERHISRANPPMLLKQAIALAIEESRLTAKDITIKPESIARKYRIWANDRKKRTD